MTKKRGQASEPTVNYEFAEKDIRIENYSPHLFWDVDKSDLNLNQHKEFLVNRVLDYGRISDWHQLKSDIGLEKIGSIAIELRDLDPRAVAFVAVVCNIDEKDFRCYSLRQSLPQHWHF